MNEKLIIAAKKVVEYHNWEDEGLMSGRATAEEWRMALGNLQKSIDEAERYTWPLDMRSLSRVMKDARDALASHHPKPNPEKCSACKTVADIDALLAQAQQPVAPIGVELAVVPSVGWTWEWVHLGNGKRGRVLSVTNPFDDPKVSSLEWEEDASKGGCTIPEPLYALSDLEKLLALPQTEKGEGWVSVKERLPEIPEGSHAIGVLLATFDPGDGSTSIQWASWDGVEFAQLWGKRGETFAWEDVHDQITHWQPLPSPPQGAGKKA